MHVQLYILTSCQGPNILPLRKSCLQLFFTVWESVPLSPGPAQLSINCCTCMGRAWEQGYVGNPSSGTCNHLEQGYLHLEHLPYSCLSLIRPIGSKFEMVQLYYSAKRVYNVLGHAHLPPQPQPSIPVIQPLEC